MANTNYFMVSNDVFDKALTANLEHTQFRVLMALLRYSNSGSTTCYPSISTLAQKCSMSISSVKTAIGVLEQQGFILRQQQGSNLKQQSNLYKVASLGIPSLPKQASRKRGKRQGTPTSTAQLPVAAPASPTTEAPDPGLKELLGVSDPSVEMAYFIGCKLKHSRISDFTSIEALDEHLSSSSGRNEEQKQKQVQKLWDELLALTG